MPQAARLGDPTSHPGTIIKPCVMSVLIEGQPAARAGSTHLCALPPKAGPHPPNPLVGGSGTVHIGGGNAMRVGDKAACGAVVLRGASNVIIGG
jgi:uncharacterized Zn-binding protein involved in type VI secretion